MSLHHIRALRAVAPLPANGRHPGLALLMGVTDLEDKRALVLGHSAVDLVCILIRSGCTEVIELRSTDRPKPSSADLVLIPRVSSLTEATIAIGHAWRALNEPGLIRLYVPGHLAAGATRILRLYGFTASNRWTDIGGSLLSACKLNATICGRA